MSTVIQTGPLIERRESRRFTQFDLPEDTERRLDAKYVSIRSSDSESAASSRDHARTPIWIIFQHLRLRTYAAQA